MTAPESKATPGMVDVLADSLRGWMVFPVRIGADGSAMPMTTESLCTHVADALEVAGFGHIATARAEALREAANFFRDMSAEDVRRRFVIQHLDARAERENQ